jgi:hypothetical protein
MTAPSSLLAKVESLSEERLAIVASLVDELAELQAREDAEDVAAAREALARIASGERPEPWEKVKADLDVVHGHD